MADRRRCSPSSRDAGPVDSGWSGSRASRCQGEHDALTKRHREARRQADHVRGGGALDGEETRASGAHRASPNARTGVRERTNRRMAHALGENGRGGARAPMAMAVLCACGARARERELTGANGSKGGGGRGRALLVADQGASRRSHARHAAAEFCGLATAARPSARGHGAGASAGAGKGRARAGLGRLRPAGQK